MRAFALTAAAEYAPRRSMAVAVLMPVFNAPPALSATLVGVREQAEALGGVTVFLVDDGSEQAVDPGDLPSPSAHFRLVLARHALNLGQGAALETARQLALRGGSFAAYVTMDSDGQHRPQDLGALVLAVEKGADVAFGNRFLGDSNVPPVRRAVLFLARLFERVVTGLPLADAHNGFRAFSQRAITQLYLRQNRMAHATEIKQQIARASAGSKLAVVEVPVSVRYSRTTLAQGQPSLGAFTILRDLFHRYLFEGPE
jgi:glycosyltransferase involved in cell wall biosynthesis